MNPETKVLGSLLVMAVWGFAVAAVAFRLTGVCFK